MSLLFLFAACCAGLVSAGSAPPIDLEQAELHFESFIQQYGRQYADENEKQARFHIFKDNLKRYNHKNENSNSAVYGIMEFSDLTLEEFSETQTGFMPSEPDRQYCTLISEDQIPNVNAPESFDWRDHNVVTSVKKQLCRDCYAFSAVGHIEGQYAIKYKQLVEFSAQQIIDCEKYSLGCMGGWMDRSLRWLIEHDGLETLSDYPYAVSYNYSFVCKFNATKAKAKLVDCQIYNFTSHGHEKLKQLLYQTGPISIALDSYAVEGYKSGIIEEKVCEKKVSSGHAVLLVGYGQEKESGEKYWILKNSYGANFGEHGYFRVRREEGTNTCRMMTLHITTAVLA